MKYFFSLLLFLSMNGSYLYAASYSWTGLGTTSNWSDAGNWSPNTAAPGTGDDVTINSGTVTPVMDMDVSVNNFTISNYKSLDLNGHTLSIAGSATFSSGSIISSTAIGNISVSSSTTVTNFSSTGNTMTFGDATFNVNINVVALGIGVAGGLTVNGSFTIEKMGNGYNVWTAGNTFNGPFKVSLTGGTGGNGFYIGYTTSNPDIFNGTVEAINNIASGVIHFSSGNISVTQFNGDIKFTNNSNGLITVANDITAPTSFNNATVTIKGNVEVNSTNTGSIVFAEYGNPNNASLTIDGNKNFYVGAGGFSSGGLVIKKVIQQNGGTVPFDLVLGSTGTALNVYNCDILGGTFSAGDVRLQSSIFHGNVVQTKTSNATYSIENDNYYHGTVTYNQNGGNTWYTGDNNNNQTYEGDVYFNSNSGTLYCSYKNTTNYNGNIILNGNGGNIYFSPTQSGVANGSELADTKTITTNTFNVGTLTLRNFNQNGSTIQNLALGGTASLTLTSGTIFNATISITAPTVTLSGAQFMGTGNANGVVASSTIYFSSGTLFFGSLNATAPNIYVGASTFNSDTHFEKTGSSQNISAGGNTFVSTLEIINSSSGFMYFGNSSPDVFNGDVTTTITSNGGIVLAYNTQGNLFNGDIIVNNTSNGSIYICVANANSGASLNSGKIRVGYQFSGGYLYVHNLSQPEPPATVPLIELTFSGTGVMTFGTGNNLYSELSLDAYRVIFQGGVYNGIVTANISNCGGPWTGTIVFMNDVTINYSGTTTSCNFAINNTTTDNTDNVKFKGNVTFNRNNFSYLMAARCGVMEFYKNVTYNSTYALIYEFGYSGGACKFLGDGDQYLYSNQSELKMVQVEVNKPSGNLILNTSLKVIPSPSGSVSPQLFLTKGNIISTSTNIVTLSDNAIVTGGSSNSLISGPAVKLGNDAFTFPIGKGTVYAPILMSAPATTTDAFQAEYFNTSPTAGTITIPLLDVSNCEYWNVQRTAGSSSVSFTLNWPASGCSPINSNVLRVGINSGTSWTDAGANSVTGSNSSGSITTNALSSFGQLTFGYNSLMVLDTRQVNETLFNISSAIEPIATCTSGVANGTPAGSKTMVSSSNNTPGILVLHPTLSSTVPVTINPGVQNSDMTINLAVDGSSNITGVQGDFESSMYEMSGDYYSIQSISGVNSYITFLKQKAASSTLDITTNLTNGLTFDASSSTPFRIIIPGAGFSQYNLRVLDKSNTQVYSSNNILSTPIEWNGLNGSGTACADGVYKFELDIVSGGNTNTYYGQLILKH